MDYFDILLAKKLSGGGGGEITVEGLSVEENGTYTAPSGKAYSPVVVNLPLGEKSITENGEYLASADDLKGFSKVTVNVAGFTKKAMPTGAISSFNDGTANPLTKLKIAINPVQAGSGDPSPSNPRAISGWTGANIHVADGENPHVIDNVVNVSWQTEAGTVYGGELDVTSGVTNDRFIFELDGTEKWQLLDTTGSRRFRIRNDVLTESGMLCTHFKQSTLTENWGYYRVGSGYLNLWDEGKNFNNETELNAWLAQQKTNGTPVQFCYEGTPTTYQLTPTQVSSILGTNNIWADTGDILEGEYFTSL